MNVPQERPYWTIGCGMATRGRLSPGVLYRAESVAARTTHTASRSLLARGAGAMLIVRSIDALLADPLLGGDRHRHVAPARLA
jgi:hypothetical protein